MKKLIAESMQNHHPKISHLFYLLNN